MDTKLKRWRKANREKYAEWTREYRRTDWQAIQRMLEDPDEYLFERDARKRSDRKRACPIWADRGAIRRVYAECVRLSQQHGIGMRVIHEIPIRGRRRCGLHIAENLRVVSERYAELYRG